MSSTTLELDLTPEWAATSKKKSVLFRELDSKSSKEPRMQMNVKEIPFADTVVVLGGGISGLFAARELSRRGHKVVLIEAQNRLGGRVYPVEVEGVELQLGATYMHDTGDSENPNMLISELRAKDGLQSLGQAVRLNSPSISIISEDPESEGFNSALNQMLEGCSADKLSPYDRDGLDGSYEGGEDNFFLYDGYSALLQELEAELIDNSNCYILKKTVITEVTSLGNNKHFLKTKDGIEFICKGVVCALPIGVLQEKSVKFNPSLPSLINVINPGVARRLAIKFEDQFVNQGCSHIILHDAETNMIFRILNLDYYRKAKDLDVTAKNCLVVTYVDLHPESEQLKLEIVVQKIKSCLKEQYGQQYDDTIEMGIVIADHDWSNDRYCMSGWSSFNQTIADKESFDDWFLKINEYSESCNLYFAGEYMSKGGAGTVHGAALSGQQAALKLEKSLKSRQQLPLDLGQEKLLWSWNKETMSGLKSQPNRWSRRELTKEEWDTVLSMAWENPSSPFSTGKVQTTQKMTSKEADAFKEKLVTAGVDINIMATVGNHKTREYQVEIPQKAQLALTALHKEFSARQVKAISTFP